jgi:hypothetical protein
MSAEHLQSGQLKNLEEIMRAVIAIVGLALALSPVTAMAKPHKASSHSMHAGKMKTTCKGEFMYSKGGKCMDARDKAAS